MNDPTFSGGRDLYVDIAGLDDELTAGLIERLQADGYQARRPLPSEGTHPHLLLGPSDRHGAAVQHLLVKCASGIFSSGSRTEIFIDIDDVAAAVVDEVETKLREHNWTVGRRPASEGTAPSLILSKTRK
jgi:hypothetical protein